ncbi:MAG: hypothetical protein ACE5EK_07875, partial [Nitrospinales bacterium]
NERPRITRYQVYQQLQGELSSREIEEHLEMMPEDYLATVQPERIVLHLHLTRSLDGKLFVLHQQFNEKVGYHSITLCSVAGEETFKKMVGSLTANNLNILGAQVYLRRDGVILITIQVDGHGESDQTIDLEHVFPDLEKNLEDVLENRKDIRDLLKSRKRYVVGKNKPRPITPKIQIDNTTSPAYTVVRVEARDHIGMLYKIAKILADFQVQIHRAKIACKGDRGVDVFYVTLRDTKITFKHLTRRIKENLINVLLSEQLEDLN